MCGHFLNSRLDCGRSCELNFGLTIKIIECYSLGKI